MTKPNYKAILDVAIACEDAHKHGLEFNMGFYGSPHPKYTTTVSVLHGCGTPACAFGQWAARGDLQRVLTLSPVTGRPREIATGEPAGHLGMVAKLAFGLDEDQLSELFDPNHGCRCSRAVYESMDIDEREEQPPVSAQAAARYIRRFVARLRASEESQDR